MNELTSSLNSTDSVGLLEPSPSALDASNTLPTFAWLMVAAWYSMLFVLFQLRRFERREETIERARENVNTLGKQSLSISPCSLLASKSFPIWTWFLYLESKQHCDASFRRGISIKVCKYLVLGYKQRCIKLYIR